MSAIIKPIALDETLQRVADATEAIALNQIIDVDASWEQIRSIVRNGLGSKAIPIGTQFIIQHDEYTNLTFDVVAHSNYVNPATGTKCMTLMQHDTIGPREFDAVEALIYTASGLSAGTHIVHLTDDYDASHGGGLNYSFTLTNAVPAGGQITIDWPNNQTPVSVSTYASASSDAAIETATLTVTDSAATIAAADVNYPARARFGSNHWGESNLRQWLNSSGNAGEWFEPQTKWDRLPSYANVKGYLNGFDTDFLAATCDVEVATDYNTVFNTDGEIAETYTTRDRVYVSSMTEIGMVGGDEGTVFKYYADGNAELLLKYRHPGTSNRALWWQRTVNPESASQVYELRSLTLNPQAVNAAQSGINYSAAPVINIG